MAGPWSLVLVTGAVLLCGCAGNTGTARAQDAGARWRRHEPGTRWQWQLSSRVGTPLNVDAYDVDGSDTGEQTVNSLHANGSKAICYMSVGSWENRKPDENKFPNEALGNDYDGWPGERWLDIRRIGVLAPIMGARMYVRKRKGFDAVEPDNMGGCTNKTGFELTAADQLRTTRGGPKPPTRGGSPSPSRTPRIWRAPSWIASTLRSSRTASTRADANR